LTFKDIFINKKKFKWLGIVKIINGLNPRASFEPCSAANCGESDPNEIENKGVEKG